MRLVERVERIILGAYKKELARSALSGTTLLGQLAKKALAVFSFVSIRNPEAWPDNLAV
jgi:hypothetical protein